MKVLLLDTDSEGMGIDLGLRARDAGHEVRYFLPTRGGEPLPYGDGMFKRPREFAPSMDWADLIVLIGNSTYAAKLEPYFEAGYPIFGANKRSAELELDRSVGQKVLEDHGIETLPFQVVSSPEEGIALIAKEDKPYVLKPWGGDADKAMTCVANSPDEAIFTLTKWKEEGKFKGQLMLQEKVDGVEIGISGWFSPGGWSALVEESFEHKKFMNDDLGCNTGEQGTVIRHVRNSKLFDMLLAPLTDYFAACKYVGDASVNCIVTEDGKPMPLEFTQRIGWPDFCIRQEVIRTDPVEWMLDLVNGKDSYEASEDIAVGVVMTHGDYPRSKDPPKVWSGYPITGITPENYDHVHFQQVMEGSAPMLIDGKVKEVETTVTAGDYVMVVTGAGETVREAAKGAYEVAWEVKWPSNIMMRTDVGKRLRADLPKLQEHGFAEGMEY